MFSIHCETQRNINTWKKRHESLHFGVRQRLVVLSHSHLREEGPADCRKKWEEDREITQWQQRARAVSGGQDCFTCPLTPPTPPPAACIAARTKGRWRKSKGVPAKLRIWALGKGNMCWHVNTRSCAEMWIYGESVMRISTTLLAAVFKWCFNYIKCF